MTSMVIVVHYLAVFLLAIQVESAVYDGDCHGPWMYQHNETSECKCGSTLNGKVQCNMNTSTLTVDTCVCMTYCTLHIGMARGVCIIVYITFSVLIFLKYSIELIYIELRDSLRIRIVKRGIV